jgi:hypothetical protein
MSPLRHRRLSPERDVAERHTRTLLFRSGPDAYTIYSVGQDQQDDGGDLTSELQRANQRGWGRRIIGGADVGVRILVWH